MAPLNTIKLCLRLQGGNGLRRDGSTGSPCTALHPEPVERSVERQTCLSVPPCDPHK